MIWVRKKVSSKLDRKKEENEEIYLAPDGPVGKDAVQKNVESLAAVEDSVDPLDRD